MRRLCLSLALAGALICVAPAHAQRFIELHTIEVHTEAVWPGELIAFGGLYWGTAYGVCPAGPIQVSFEQARRPTRMLGQVPATSVIPFSGGFSAQLSLPEDARLGRGMLRFVQREREVSGSGLCVEARHPAERGYGLRIQRRPAGAPCTPANGCAPTPVPELEIVAPPGPTHRPGDGLPVAGHDFPDAYNDRTCPSKTGLFQAIWFYLTDSSGSSQRVDTGILGNDGELQDTIPIPSRGVALGRAVISAVPRGYEGDPVCGNPGTATLNIGLPPPTVTFQTEVVAGASVTISGDWWRTDRCDSRVDLVLLRGRAERALKRVKPGPLGAFEATVKVPSGKGQARIVAVHRRSLEVADPFGRPGKSRCVRPARTLKSKRVIARKAPPAPPPPGPIGPPAPTPAPAPAPTLEARQTGADSLRLTGAHWERGTCDGGKANPVTITLAHAGKPAETIGTAAPADAGTFTTELQPVTVSTGDQATATQTRCDGSGLSATATVSPA